LLARIYHIGHNVRSSGPSNKPIVKNQRPARLAACRDRAPSAGPSRFQMIASTSPTKRASGRALTPGPLPPERGLDEGAKRPGGKGDITREPFARTSYKKGCGPMMRRPMRFTP
jgi:hypothetical protein